MYKSYYQIIGNKLIFSDRRFDDRRKDIVRVFSLTDSIEGSYRPLANFDEANSEGFRKLLELHKNLRRKIEDCRHKAKAVGYSLTLIKQECSHKLSVEEMKGYSEMIASKMCDTAEINNEVLIYEVESFLFQIKSNLDILIQVLKYLYEYLIIYPGKDKEAFTLSGNEKDTIEKMRNAGDNEMAEFFKNQVTDWFGELLTMRNIITHKSDLKGFSSFVFESGKEIVKKPTMPNGENVEDYCEEIFKKLLGLYEEVFTKFVIPKNLEYCNAPYI